MLQPLDQQQRQQRMAVAWVASCCLQLLLDLILHQAQANHLLEAPDAAAEAGPPFGWHGGLFEHQQHATRSRLPDLEQMGL